MPVLRSTSSSCQSVAFSVWSGHGGIARRRADAAILLADQLFVREPLVRRIAPELTAHALVQTLGQRFGEPIRQRLEQDRVVVIVCRLEARDMRLDADAGGHRERADVVGTPVAFGATKSARQ